MSDYGDTTLREHRRLEILRHLEGCAEYTGNAEVVLDVLRGLRIGTTRDQLVTELAWLREQGLVAYEDRDGFLVVTVVTRGVEVARGQAFHPGIRRPGPRR